MMTKKQKKLEEYNGWIYNFIGFTYTLTIINMLILFPPPANMICGVIGFLPLIFMYYKRKEIIQGL